jgi:hypothetical protein
MSTTGTTVLSNLMRQKLNPAVKQSFVNDPILLMLLDRAGDARKVNNKGEDITVRTSPSPSFGALGESALFPVAGSPDYSKMNVTNKLHYAQGEVSGLAWLMQDVDAIGSGKVKQVAGMLGNLIEGETDDFKQKLNRFAYGTGNGALSSPITAITTGASGTFTVNPAASLNGVDHIPLGARLHFYTTGGVQHATGASVSTVTAVNYTTGVVTCDSVPTDAVVGDIPVYENSYGNCMNGLRGLIQNSNITFQTLDVTNIPSLKAQIVDASSASWSQSLIDRAITRSKVAGGVNKPVNDFAILTHPYQSDAVRNAGYALNTVTAGSDRASGKLDLGFPLISTNGMRIREDVDCGKSEMWGIRLSTIQRYSLFEPGLRDIIPGSMFAPKPGSSNYYDIYQYLFCFIGNLGVDNPNANFLIKNLSYSALG